MQAGRKRPLVLAIEDDLAARRLYAESRIQAGFDAAEAHNGLQAVEKVRELLPDIIVTDLGLPGIDGYELRRRLQQDEQTARTPIVAITGRYFSAADVARARREGCHTVLIKPFVSEDLIAEVRRALDSTGEPIGSDDVFSSRTHVLIAVVAPAHHAQRAVIRQAQLARALPCLHPMAKSRRRESRDSSVSALNEDVGAPQSTGDTRAASGERKRIAERAYELYVTRGGGDGRDLDDWLEAERDLARRRRGRDHEDDQDSDPAA